MYHSPKWLPAALLLPVLLALRPACAAGAAASFPLTEPEKPLHLALASRAQPTWGRVGPLRLVYYTTDAQPFRDEDRRTIAREVKLIHDFYAHYGLELSFEPRVYEVKGEIPADLPAEQHDYYFIKKRLEKLRLLEDRRTIVFTTFDVGLGAEMALTGLNDSTTRRLECPNPEKGYRWFCNRPESAHWGGSVHEVGHMLGLSHPSEFDAAHPYVYADGRAPYVYVDSDEFKSVMGAHYKFFRDPRIGLLPHELDTLKRAFRDR